MRGPFDEREERDSARREAGAAARERYPAGKELGRIQYFEKQRGLPLTIVEDDGRVVPAAAPPPRVTKGAPRGRVPRAKTPALYAKAMKAKQKLDP